jgi:hypothetical protein
MWVRIGLSAFAVAALGIMPPSLAESAPKKSIVISNYTKQLPKIQENGLPKGWKLRIWQGKPDVKVLKEGGKNILRLRSQEASVSVYKEFKLNLRKFPRLKWRWKITKLPKNADARINSKDDQAAGVYVVFPRFPSMINSQLLAYVWETSVPEGTVLRNRKNPMVHYIVVRSGKGKLDQWITEERNVLEDYRMVFGEEPPEVGGISLQIDTDDTHSQAESFFDQIEFVKDLRAEAAPPKNSFVKSLFTNLGLKILVGGDSEPVPDTVD